MKLNKKQHTFKNEIPAPDTRGNFYISAIDGERFTLLAGPYPTAGCAEDKIDSVREIAEKIDPNAIWYSYGLAKSDSAQKGILNKMGLI